MTHTAGKRNRDIIILGVGGNSLAIADAIATINALMPRRPAYRLRGFLDDLPENRGRRVLGYPVLGEIEDARKWSGCGFINGIASVASFREKPEIIARSGLPREDFETIVHPRAVIAQDSTIGRGCAIMANSVVCTHVTMGDHVIMLQNTTVNHHSILGDFVTMSAGITILGLANIGACAFIGGAAAIAPYVRIGSNALVGMASVVIRDVADGAVVAGNPARVLSRSRFATKPGKRQRHAR